MSDSKYDASELEKRTIVSEATEVIDENGNATYEQTPAERTLVRKLDYLYVMPFIAILNFLQVKTASA